MRVHFTSSAISTADIVTRFITRNDSPPLMDALAQWRNTALRRRAAGQPLRPVSPFSEDSLPTSPASEASPDSLGYSEKTHMRAKSEPPEHAFQDEDKGHKPSNEDQKSSYSWVPWFRSSKKKEVQPPSNEAPVPLTEGQVSGDLLRNRTDHLSIRRMASRTAPRPSQRLMSSPRLLRI